MSRHRKRWLIVAIITTCIIVAAALALKAWMSGSSEGSVHVGSPTTHAARAPSQPLSVSTPYFTTTLPAGFILKRQSPDPTDAASYGVVANTSSGIDRQFAATYAPLPTDGLQGVGDYNLRRTSPTYEPVQIAALPAGAAAFHTVQGSSEITVFWQHETHYLSLSLSTQGSASEQQLQADYVQVMSSWQWK